MSGSLNKVQIIGSLGADPEVKSFQNGGKVVNLRVATSESWKDKNTGEKKERTQWHSIAIFNEGLAGVAERYLKKGSKVYLEGQLETRKWQDHSGNDRYSTEIVLRPYNGTLILLGERSGGGAQREDREERETDTGGGYGGLRQGSLGDDLGDEIPF